MFGIGYFFDVGGYIVCQWWCSLELWVGGCWDVYYVIVVIDVVVIVCFFVVVGKFFYCVIGGILFFVCQFVYWWYCVVWWFGDDGKCGMCFLFGVGDELVDVGGVNWFVVCGNFVGGGYWCVDQWIIGVQCLFGVYYVGFDSWFFFGGGVVCYYVGLDCRCYLFGVVWLVQCYQFVIIIYFVVNLDVGKYVGVNEWFVDCVKCYGRCYWCGVVRWFWCNDDVGCFCECEWIWVGDYWFVVVVSVG